MDFDFNEQQSMLKTMARDFLAGACTKSRVRELEKDEKGYDPDMFSKMAELGWMGLIFPEKYGGMGAEFLDLMVLMEEMGRNITPGPFFSTMGLCAIPILKFGTETQKRSIFRLWQRVETFGHWLIQKSPEDSRRLILIVGQWQTARTT